MHDGICRELYSDRPLGAGAGLRRPTYAQAARVSLESPALDVMTDLARVTPATIRPQAPLAGANQFMIARGVDIAKRLETANGGVVIP